MNKWMRCADALPDEDQTVIVFIPESCDPVVPAFLDGGEWYDYHGGPIDFSVTHWMDLPEAPGE